jgi:putative FmdB family regulatory protein
MPLYEYQCGACGHRFELIQKFSDPPVEVCPSCGERQVSKLLSSPAIQFKGSGWYITDYARKGGGTDAAAKPDGTEKAAGKDSDTKSSPSDTSTSSSPSGATGTAPATPASKQS